MAEAAAQLGHNLGPTVEAENLIAAYERAPEILDIDSAGAAVVLAKQMKMESDRLETERKSAAQPFREQQAVVEAPYKKAAEDLDLARSVILSRLAVYMDAEGIDRVPSEYGPKAYTKDASTFTVTDQAALPRRFKKTVVDTKAIEKAIRAGESIPGIQHILKKQVIVT